MRQQTMIGFNDNRCVKVAWIKAFYSVRMASTLESHQFRLPLLATLASGKDRSLFTSTFHQPAVQLHYLNASKSSNCRQSMFRYGAAARNLSGCVFILHHIPNSRKYSSAGIHEAPSHFYANRTVFFADLRQRTRCPSTSVNNKILNFICW